MFTLEDTTMTEIPKYASPNYRLSCNMFLASLFGFRSRCWCPSPDRESDSPPPYVYNEASPLLARRWTTNQSAGSAATLTQFDGASPSQTLVVNTNFNHLS